MTCWVLLGVLDRVHSPDFRIFGVYNDLKIAEQDEAKLKDAIKSYVEGNIYRGSDELLNDFMKAFIPYKVKLISSEINSLRKWELNLLLKGDETKSYWGDE